MEKVNQKEEEKKPMFQFFLPPENKPLQKVADLANGGDIDAVEEFNPILTKKEFNFYLIKNLEPMIMLIYGLIAEVDRLHKKEEEREKLLTKK